MSIRILLAEDQFLIREALKDLIEREPDFEVVAEADDGRDAVQLAGETRPDVVIMDISMPHLNGVEATRRIRNKVPGVKVIALTMHTDRLFVSEMLRSGASGFLVKHGSFEELVTAVRSVISGRTYLSPSVANVVVEGFLNENERKDPSPFNVLSQREREVLQLLADGKTAREIASQLSISRSTVESHRRQLKIKLKVDTMAGLIKYAIRHGLTNLDS